MPPLRRLRGDELDLYGSFYAELARKIARDVNAPRETIEMRARSRGGVLTRPARTRWQLAGWLYRVAQREAWRLRALE